MNESTNGSNSQNVSFGQTYTADYIQIPINISNIILSIGYGFLLVLKRSFRQNRLNWFISDLCLTVTLFSSAMLILNIQKIIEVPYFVSCRLQGFMINHGVSQLMYCHATVAVSRVFAIVYATKRVFQSAATTIFFMCISSTISLLVCIPSLLFNGFPCGPTADKDFLPYYLIVFTLFLPILIVGISNFRILYFVRRSTRQINAMNGSSRVSQARDIHLVKTLLGTFAVFVVGWVPVYIVRTFFNVRSLSNGLIVVLFTLPSLTTLIDICLLIYTNQPVRSYLKEIFLRRKVNINNRT